jgi:hypothetical protein
VVLDASHQGGLFHVNSSDSLLVLEGLVLRNAQSPDDWMGGAVNMTAGALRATSCEFASNNASGWGGAIGGVIKSLELSGCNFTDNWGGAVYVGSNWGGATTITVTESHFSNNHHVGFVGMGAIQVESGGGTLMTVARTTFTSHTNVGIAIYLLDLSIAGEMNEYSFTDCIFADNMAGSTIDISGGQAPLRASFVRCDFTNNTGIGDFNIGGLALQPGLNGTTYELTNCTFTSNTGNMVGAIFIQPFSPYPFSTTITDCTFADNQCTDGTCATYIYDRSGQQIKVNLPAGGAIQVIPYAYASANTSVRIVNTQFRAQTATTANATSDTTVAAGYNDIFQNDTFGGMVQFCCPSPSPHAPHAPPHSSDSSSTARADDDTKCVLMPTSFLLVSQLPPAQKIVHC